MKREEVHPEEAWNQASIHEELWGNKTPVVGMIHLLPLPGSPRYRGSMDEILARASEDSAVLSRGGLDGILVENFGDAPFFPDRVPPETVAALAVAVREVGGCTELPLGVNVLRNDAEAAVGVAAGAGASFIRVNVHTGSMYTDQGLLEGRAHHTLRRMGALGSPRAILADVMVKHATPPPGLTLEAAARDTWFRGLAHGLVLTGTQTGEPVDPGTIQRTRDVVPEEARIWVGSGVTAGTVADFRRAADGIIVGSALQRGGVAGAGIDPQRVDRFMEAAERG